MRFPTKRRFAPATEIGETVSLPYCDHLDEETLEIYLLGRLLSQQTFVQDESDLDIIETHLGICETCFLRAELLNATLSEIRRILASEQSQPKWKVMTAGANY